MALSLNKKVDLVLYYQCFLAIIAVFTFFTNLDNFLFDLGMAPQPKNLVILLGIASTPLLFSFSSRLESFPLSVLSWCAGYVLVSLFSFLLFLSSEVALQEVETRILSVLFILIMLLVFSKYYIVQIWARRAVLIAVLIAVFNNFYAFVNPLVFTLDTSGRPAGFYINPNISGCALILGMICSVGLLRPRYRIPFILIVSLGILVTFSRGAILGWFIVVIILIITRMLPRSQLLYWVIGLAMTTIGLTSTLGALLNLDQLQDLGFLNENTLGRIAWFQNPSESEDSADSRLEIARLGWQLFAEHPLWGNGIGSTLELSTGYSTHNMYISLMADHGILGAFILPLLVYVVTRHACGESKYIGFAFAAFILFWGLFSHNVLEERFILLIFSLMAAMSVTSQLEQKSQVKHKL